MTAQHPEPLRDEVAPLSRAVMRLAHAQRGIAAARLAPLGLFPGQEIVLGALWNDDGLAQRDLGRLLGLDHSTIAKSVQRLERAGLVRRGTSPDDGRVTLVHVTDAGRALEEPVRQIWVDLEARWDDALEPEERAHLVALLAKAAKGSA